MTVTVGNGTPPAGANSTSASAPGTPRPSQQPVARTRYSLNKIPNELRGYASFNYTFTLACLTPEELNFPDQNYRVKAPLVTVLRSGGGAAGKALTAYETSQEQLEYFIDNVEIETIIVPTRSTRTSNATTLSFDIVEPYSMGLFLQTLQIAARRAGHVNYNRAPYALILEFIGYDDEGKVVTSSRTRRVFPFKFVTVDFEVDAGGSKYKVQGVAWNEQAQSNVVQTVKTDTTIVGNNLAELLQRGPNSLTTIMNQRLREKEEKGEGIFRDEYIILFPEDLASGNSDLARAASTTQSNSATMSPEEAYFRLTGVPADQSNEEARTAASETIKNYISLQASNNRIVGALRSMAANEATTNAIGKATIASTLAEGGNVPFGRPALTLKTVGDRQFYDNGQVQVSKDFRSFQFPQGTSIEKIIEEMIVLSSYGQAAATTIGEDKQGDVPWFRVQTQVFMAPDPAVLAQTGENPKVYVYLVVPYKVHSSVFGNPTVPSTGTSERISVARKEYNYIYTGKNEDILDFKIELNNNFYSAISGDNGMGAAGIRTAASQGTNEPGNNSRYAVNEGAAGVNSRTGISRVAESVIESQVSGGGAGYTNTSIEIARQFNEAIVNARADLLSLDLSIMGDPYYLADTGVGNYNSEEVGPGLTADGTMNHQRGEVDVVLNFRTPIDYDMNSGLMRFPDETIAVKGFSGLYKVNIVKNSFSGGKFTQVLEMIRRPRQELDTGEQGSPNAGRVFQPADPGSGYGSNLSTPAGSTV